MNKRGIALIFSLLVTVVLVILVNSFFVKTINENNAVKRHVFSVRAFWAAEAGIAEAIDNLPASPTNGFLGSCRYETTTSYRTTINSSNYYDINSIGIIAVPGGEVRRTVSVVVKNGAVDPSKFKYGIGAANDLCFGGACKKPAEDYLDPDVCNGGPCWKDFDNTINFQDLFGYSQSDVKAVATQYTDANFMAATGGGAVGGVTWVDVAAGNTLNINGSAAGSGILIINGDARIEGTYQFHGIIYVLGTLTARGTMDAYGSTIVASSAGIDTINGTPEFHYNVADITSALQQLASNFANVVSWKEIP